MTRNETIKALKKYFAIKELVCDHIYAKLGEGAWQCFSTHALENLLVLRRDVIGLPMVCNTKDLHQRGMRCNMCEIVKEKTAAYLSAHVLGEGWDFTIIGMTTQEARNRIKEDQARFPHPCRIEGGVNWLHFDCVCQDGVTTNVYEFWV